jgi:hypothetical protein
MCSSFGFFQKLKEQTGGFHERTSKELWASLWSLSDQIKDWLPTLITNSGLVPISDTRMTTGAYQHVAPDHVVNGGQGHEASLCKEQYWIHTHSPSLLSQKSFQHPSLFADIVRGAQVNCVFSNCQLCHELLVCLLCLISLIKRLQNSQVHNWLLLSTQLPIVPTTMTHTAEIFFFSVIIVCNTRCTTKCLSFPTCAHT